MKWTTVLTVKLLLFFTFLSFARPSSAHDNQVPTIQIGVDNYIHSNTLPNRFFNEFFTDRTISEETKNLAISRLKENNRFGNYTDYYLKMTQPIHTKLLFHAGYNNLDYLGANISTDFFKLLFEGNTKYKGTSLDFSRTSLLAYKYDQLYMGLSANYNNKLSFGMHVGVIKGNELIYLDMPDASLFTSSTGDSIALDGEFSLTSVPYTDRWSTQGWGLSCSFFGSYQHEKHTVSASIKNVGFIRWNMASQYHSEGTKSYTGLASDGLFSAELFQFDDNAPEEALGIEEVTEDLLMALPLIVALTYRYDGFDQWQLAIGGNYVNSPGYVPQLIASGLYKFLYGINVGFTCIAGGYTRFDYGIQLEKIIRDRILVGCKSFYLETWLAPSKTTGQGMSLYASYQF